MLLVRPVLPTIHHSAPESNRNVEHKWDCRCARVKHPAEPVVSYERAGGVLAEIQRQEKPTVRKRLPCAIIVFAIALLAGIPVYYAGEIVRARAHTRKVVVDLLEPGALPLDVSDLTESQVQILLAVQDPGFWDHRGVDLTTPGAGMTTITQGLVKRFYFEQFRPGPAKIKQTLIAVLALDPYVAKEDQLRLFINSCYLGSKDGQAVEGFGDAAQAYYGKPLEELGEDEYISLVAMLIAPGTFNVDRHPDWNAERVARIKQLVSGEYQPKGVFDLYYGEMSDDVREAGLPPLSYFAAYYEQDRAKGG